MAKNRRIGKFKVSFDLIDAEGTGILFSLLQFTPLDIQDVARIYDPNCLIYTGYSPAFDQVPEGEPIPEYEIATAKINGLTTLDYVRQIGEPVPGV